ncbi:MAG: TetR/AcrR family transcriptional regulator [Lysinibacillus sp.]
MARGRRVNSSGERSKQLLLDKAIELFSTHGYHQTKISDIVKAANLTQPTFYLYFQSKESLFNDLNEQFEQELLEVFRKNRENKIENLRIQILENLKNTFSFFKRNPNLTKIGFFESANAEKVKSHLVQEIVHTLNNERGSFNVDLHTIAESLLGTIERLTLSTLLTNRKDPEKLAEDIVDIYFVNEYEKAGV